MYPDQGNSDLIRHSDENVVVDSLPDTDLYNYYFEHVLPGSDDGSSSHAHPTMDSLSKESRLLLHSLLAVSAVRLAWDMISQDTSPEISAVHTVLLRGYHHYNMASKIMRMKLSHSGVMDADQVMTSTLMVLPFAAASQQISHWLSTQRTDLRSYIPLSSTPRDVITFARGARTIMEILFPMLSTTDVNRVSTATMDDSHLRASELPSKQRIKSMIVSSSRDAWAQLQTRLDALSYDGDNPLDHEVSACKHAFGVLVDLRSSAIAVPTSQDLSKLFIESAPSNDATGWLHSFVHWPCRVDSRSLLPAEPLTRLLLSFYAQISQSYLDLVLPLLDQRLERPVGEPSDWFALSLTRTQALALDIYAHWSVLMFLVAKKSWWIGTLPVFTLTGLLNRYGSDFVRRLWPECAEQEQWWPAEMLQRLEDDETA